MTEIDPKALEHACLCAGHPVHHFDLIEDDMPLRASIVAHARAIEREEATEARHAEELRELKERFSEALMKWFWDGSGAEVPPLFRPFIIPAPDPLVEALQQAYDAAVAELGEDYVRRLSWFPSARKIGEAGE